jgi:head-tail adaptor
MKLFSEDFRHLILFMSFTTSRDAMGEVTKSYSDYTTVGGHVRHLRGSEKVASGVEMSEEMVVVTLRWSPTVDSIDTTYQFVFDSKTYEIIEVDPYDHNNGTLKITGRRITDG